MYILSKSLSFQRYIKTARASMEKSLERLSSGLRVVRAADDPAGMAVATSLRARLGPKSIDVVVFNVGRKVGPSRLDESIDLPEVV